MMATPRIFTNHGYCPLQINDILESARVPVKVANPDTKHMFTFKNMNYKFVKLRGTVVMVQKKDGFWRIFLDDGTAEITCYYEFPNELNEAREQLQTTQEWHAKNCDAKNPASLGALVMLNSCLKSFNDLNDDFKLGQTIEIMGKLKEYHGIKRVYITHMRRIDERFIATDGEENRKISFENESKDFYEYLQKKMEE